MQALDLDRMSLRKEAEEFLERMLEDKGVVQFLTKNIYRQKQTDVTTNYAWRFNLDVLAEEIEEVGMATSRGAEISTLFLYGTQSDYVKEADRPQILELFSKTIFQSLNTGPWVHAEDADGFVEAVRAFVG